MVWYITSFANIGSNVVLFILNTQFRYKPLGSFLHYNHDSSNNKAFVHWIIALNIFQTGMSFGSMMEHISSSIFALTNFLAPNLAPTNVHTILISSGSAKTFDIVLWKHSEINPSIISNSQNSVQQQPVLSLLGLFLKMLLLFLWYLR